MVFFSKNIEVIKKSNICDNFCFISQELNCQKSYENSSMNKKNQMNSKNK